MLLVKYVTLALNMVFVYAWFIHALGCIEDSSCVNVL